MLVASRPLLVRILSAIGSGSVALGAASCGGQAELPPSPDTGQDAAGADSATDTDGGALPDAPPDTGVSLPPLPVPDGGYPHCVGETTQYTGPCCDEVYCYTPPAGGCLAPQDVTQADLGVYAPGSGTCECGRAGPFDPEGAAAYTDKLGSCCYVVGTQSCMGRPLTVEGQVRLAEVAQVEGWRGTVAGLDADLLRALDTLVSSLPPAEDCRRLAEEWARDGLFEHASIASFNRFSLQLMAVGAPADLLLETQRAALDEVHHARLCFALASAYAGRGLGPGALSLQGDLLGTLDLATMAADAVREGCVNETIASLEAAVALEKARPEAVRRALAVIADDEARHAELAWRFVRWAMQAGGDRVRAAVRKSFDEALAPSRSAETMSRPTDARWADHGRLSPQERARITAQGLQEVIQVAATALLR